MKTIISEEKICGARQSSGKAVSALACTIIAEKPSVAREIARIVKASKREVGYYAGAEYNVTWAFGHLVQPALPDGYGIKGFHRDNLPIIPPVFQLVPRQVKTDKARKAVIDAMNEGKVRVIFGSTSMLGTGVNAQKRAVAVHHLDTPWRPSDLAQRDGRAVRKGNEIAKQFAGNKVDVIIYAVEKSLNSYKFNLLRCKQTFISQLKSGAMGARTIDEGAMDEKSGMNFSEYMAILSGNTDLLDKARLEKKVAALERKIQLELTPPKPEATQGQQSDSGTAQTQPPPTGERTTTEPPSDMSNQSQFIREHVQFVRPQFAGTAGEHNKRIKM